MIKITGIPDSVPDQNFEDKVVDILKEVSVNVSPKDMQDYHRFGVSKIAQRNSSPFYEYKACQETSRSRKNFWKNASPNCNVFINENLTVKNNEIAFLGRKPKCSGHLDKIYTRDRTVHISSPEIHRRKVLKIYHINDLHNPISGFWKQL